MMDNASNPDLTDAELERAVGRLYLRYAALEARFEATEREREEMEAAYHRQLAETPAAAERDTDIGGESERECE